VRLIRPTSDLIMRMGQSTPRSRHAARRHVFLTGMDQVDVEIPQSFAGKGTVTVSVNTPGGVTSNPVIVTFQ